MADEDFHKMMETAYALQSEDRKAFELWVKRENRNRNDRPVESDPNHNAYYVGSKLPPLLYRKLYQFCKTNNWSKSTAIKFFVHEFFSSKP